MIGEEPAVEAGDKIAGVMAAANLAVIGQRTLRQVCEPGVTELELWQAVRTELELAAGGPVEAVVDLMAGERTALIGKSPTEARVQEGDVVLFDLALAHDGWWADSCTTFVCGTPAPAVAQRHRTVADALSYALEAARPGLTAGEVDAEIRSRLAAAGLRCPHHTGHGVGTAAQESPWLVERDGTLLEEGMVLAFEPGAYGGGFGVRLEHLAVLELDGARPLTTHSLSLTQREAA